MYSLYRDVSNAIEMPIQQSASGASQSNVCHQSKIIETDISKSNIVDSSVSKVPQFDVVQPGTSKSPLVGTNVSQSKVSSSNGPTINVAYCKPYLKKF